MKLYLPREAAKLLKLSPQKIRNLCQSGELKAANLGTELKPRWRIAETSIQSFLDGKTPKPRQQQVEDKSHRLKGVIEFF